VAGVVLVGLVGVVLVGLVGVVLVGVALVGRVTVVLVAVPWFLWVLRVLSLIPRVIAARTAVTQGMPEPLHQRMLWRFLASWTLPFASRAFPSFRDTPRLTLASGIVALTRRVARPPYHVRRIARTEPAARPSPGRTSLPCAATATVITSIRRPHRYCWRSGLANLATATAFTPSPRPHPIPMTHRLTSFDIA